MASTAATTPASLASAPASAPSDASTLRITYFQAKGGAEVSRLCLVYGGFKFEDERLSREDWLKQKDEAPHHCVPMLTVSGTKLNQSNAIEYYCASVAGLMPSEPFLAAQVMSTMGAIGDMMGPVHRAQRIADDAEKAEAIKKAVDGVANWATIIENSITVGDDGYHYAVGGKPSLADIGIYYRMSSLREGVAKEVLNPFRFPKITSIIENFAANKRIAAWNKAHEE